MDYMFELEAAKLGHSWRAGDLALREKTKPDADGNYTALFAVPCTCGQELVFERYSWTSLSVFELSYRTMVEHVIAEVARANS